MLERSKNIVLVAMRVALCTAALAFGDVGRMMFDPTAVYAPQTSAGAVAAVPYSPGSAPLVNLMMDTQYVCGWKGERV